MKTIYTFTVIITSSMLLSAQNMPVYLNINSHNETEDPSDYSIQANYNQARQKIVEIADTIASNNARWNMQVESNFILACLAHESAGTNPNDLLDSLDALNEIEVDPHNHFDFIDNPYNYADLAYLLDSCGLASPRKNIGGFLYQTGPDWMPYQSGDTGFTFTNYIWHPNVVWGGGSPGHVNDFNAYGIWKPNGPSAQFSVHNPLRHLTCIGNGCSNVITDSTAVMDNINQIIDLINYISTQQYDPNAYWTASIQFNFRDLQMAGLADSISKIIHTLQPYVNSGQVVWMTLTEKYDNWYNLHTNVNDHFLQTCDTLPLSTPELQLASGVVMFPNPATSVVQISSSQDPVTSIAVYDMNGKVMIRNDESNAYLVEISVAGWDSGMYLVYITTSSGQIFLQKLIR
jgi:hypothetical protein